MVREKTTQGETFSNQAGGNKFSQWDNLVGEPRKIDTQMVGKKKL